MSVYKKVYRKKPPARFSLPPTFFPFILIFFGFSLTAFVSLPVLYQQFIVSPLRQKIALISAAPQPQVLSAQVADSYASLSNWQLPEDLQNSSGTVQKDSSYYLSIPKLNIFRAQVALGGEDLSNSLIQYPGTAEPGQLGTSVIFGHSILRQFYNPTNYLSIFSTIMTLSPGDLIEIEIDGLVYTYDVIELFEVQPDDTEILRQQHNGRYLKLVTCVPEGTLLRRGIILARLLSQF